MKNTTMKRVVAVLTAITLLIGMVYLLPAIADDSTPTAIKVTPISQITGTNGAAAAGLNVAGEFYIRGNSTAAKRVVSQPVNFSAAKAITTELAASEPETDPNITNSNNRVQLFTDGKPMAGNDGIMFYIETDKAVNFIPWIRLDKGASSTYAWTLKDKKVYALADGDTSWKEITASNDNANSNRGVIKLDDAFKGFIKIPNESLTFTNKAPLTDSGYVYNNITFYFTSYNETLNLTAGPLFVVNEDSASTEIVDSTAYLTVDGFSGTFSENLIGADTVSTPFGWSNNKVHSFVGAAKDTKPYVKYNGGDLTKAEAFMYYIDVPAGTSLYQTVRYFRANNTAESVGYKGSPVLALRDGASKWTFDADISISGSDIVFDKDFKGYIYLRFSDYTGTLSTQASSLEYVKIDIKGVTASKTYSISDPFFVRKNSAKSANLRDAAVAPTQYKYPAYDGETPDYTNKNVMNSWIGKPVNDILLYDYVPAAVFSATKGAVVKAVPSIAGLTKYPAFEIRCPATTANAGSYTGAVLGKFNYNTDTTVGAEGFMFYFKAPVTGAVKFGGEWEFYNAAEDKTATGKNIDGKIYIMGKDEFVWTELTVSDHYAQLPVGFEGYIRYSLRDMWCEELEQENYYLDESWALKSFTLAVAGVAAAGKVNISAPIMIDGVTNATPKKVAFAENDNTVARNFFTGEVVLPDSVLMNPLYGIPPDYSYPEYTGAPIDYTGINIMNLEPAILNDTIYIGEPLTAKAVYVNEKYGTVAAVNSITAATKYPSFAINMDTPAVSEGYKTEFAFNTNPDQTRGATSIYFYIKLPEGVSSAMGTSWNFVRGSDGKTVGCHTGAGDTYILPKGKDKWQYVKVGSHYSQLPAGFEGFIRFDLNKIQATRAQPEYGANNFFYLDENWGMKDVYIGFTSLNAEDTVYISAPLLISNYEDQKAVSNIAFIEGETNAAYNIFTGAVVVPNDGTYDPTYGAEPDYSFPEYTGTPIDYTGINIMQLKPAILNDSVYIGEAPSAKAVLVYSSYGTLTAVNSVSAATRYPSFAINMDTPAISEGYKTEFAFNTNPDQTRGATSIYFYVKLPAGVSSAMGTSWNFVRGSDGKAVGAHTGAGECYILPKGKDKWQNLRIGSHYSQLPAGFEGYVRFDLNKIQAVRAQPEYGDKNFFYLDEDWGMKDVHIGFTSLQKSQTVYISAPLLISGYEDKKAVSNIAFIEGQTNAAHHIFTGAVATPGDGTFDPTYGAEPNYDKPHYTGKPLNYVGTQIMKAKVARFDDSVFIGEPLSSKIFLDRAGLKVETVESQSVLTNYPAIKVTPTNAGTNRTAYLYFNTELTKPATGFMVYIKTPADKEITLNVAAEFTNGEVTTGANLRTGKYYLLTNGASDWESKSADVFNIPLPAGFEGYIRFNNKEFVAAKYINGSNKYLNNKWSLRASYITFKGLDVGESVYYNSFIVDEYDEKSLTPLAVFFEGDTAARDFFTGDIKTKSQLIKALEIDDTLGALPTATTDAVATVADRPALLDCRLSVKWDPTPNAAKYVVRVFNNRTTLIGTVFDLEYIKESTTTEVVIEPLKPGRRYSVVIYAYDDMGEEIAVYEYFNASTVGATSQGGAAIEDSEVDQGTEVFVADLSAQQQVTVTVDTVEENGFDLIWIAVIAGAVLVLGAGVITVIILVKKRRSKTVSKEEK